MACGCFVLKHESSATHDRAWPVSTGPLRDPPVIKGHNVGGSYSPEAHAGLGSRVWILYILLPSPFRGSTHISLYQSWFNLSRNDIEGALYTEVFRTHSPCCSNESPVYAVTYRNVTRGHSHRGGHRSLYLALNTSKHMRFGTIASPKTSAMQDENHPAYSLECAVPQTKEILDRDNISHHHPK